MCSPDENRADRVPASATIRSVADPPDVSPDSTLWHGDSRELLARVPDASVDLICTDPPYNLGGYSTGNIEMAWRKAFNNDVAAWDQLAFDPAARPPARRPPPPPPPRGGGGFPGGSSSRPAPSSRSRATTCSAAGTRSSI